MARDWTGPAEGLASALQLRYRRTGRVADLERGIDLLERAERLKPFGPFDRTAILNSLALALGERHRHTGDPRDLQRSIALHQEVVHLTAQVPAFALARPWALIQLSDALMERYSGTGDFEDLAAAAGAAEESLAGTPDGSRVRARRLSKLANALRISYAESGDTTALERAVDLARQGAALVDAGSPDEAAILYSLGLALEALEKADDQPSQLDEVVQVWERVWSLLEANLGSTPIAYRIGQQAIYAGFYAHMVAAYLRRAETRPTVSEAALRRALEVVEASKSRLLGQKVGRAGLPPPAVPSALAARERALLSRLDAFDTAEVTAYAAPGQEDSVIGVARLHTRAACQQALKDLWAEIAHKTPEAAAYVAMRRGDPPSWSDLAALAQSLGADTGLLSCSVSREDSIFLALRVGWPAPRAIRMGLKMSDWADARRRLYRELHLSPARQPRSETWDRLLRPALRRAADTLGDIERLVISPHGPSHLIPWAALAERIGWVDGRGQPVPIVTLPALGLLPNLRQRPRTIRGPGLVIGNPTGDLQYAEAEARVAAEALDTKPILRHDATRATVLGQLSAAAVVHLAAHARFVPGEPLESGILLADGLLTAREVMQRHVRANLLVLSACQTGRAESLGGEELAGLAQAFLHAGARSLVVSLWSVNDPATEALMGGFYRHLAEHSDKAVALNRAMADLRANERFNHPHYWSPFVLMGDW
jgi:hypothetical protein